MAAPSLPYTVASCSSEARLSIGEPFERCSYTLRRRQDPSFGAAELLKHTAPSKGWQCARRVVQVCSKRSC
jgi:hypothetical protein